MRHNKLNKTKFYFLMKKFFTKKTISFIFVVILFIAFLPVHSAHASFTSFIGGILSKISGAVLEGAGTIISYIVEMVLIPIASVYLAIAGSILDYSVQYTIYGQGFALMTSSIQSVWVLIRDAANICFIFVLLYAAIQQIITGVTKKDVLVSVIISAVLINFSLFTTRIIIDAGNIVATSLYTQITNTTNSSGNAIQNIVKNFGSGFTGNATKVDLSGRIMDGLNLTTIYDSPTSNNPTTPPSSNTNTTVVTSTNTANASGGGTTANPEPEAVVGIAGLIDSVIRLVLFFITAFVFMILAGLLIGRFVMLVILMTTSPIGFIGKVVPGLGSASVSWWKSLLDQVLMAPALMFFMLLTIKLSQILTSTPTKSSMILFFNYFLVIYLLLKSVEITKKLSGPVGQFADKVASTATGLAVGATTAVVTGGAALAARQTIGRAGNIAAESDYAKRLEAEATMGGFKGAKAKIQLAAIKGAAKSTFDVRNTATGKGALGQIASTTGLKIGKTFTEGGGIYGKGQTGYAGLVEKKTKDALAEADAAEKATSAYQQRVVNINPEMTERFKEKKTTEINNLNEQKTNLDNQKNDLDAQKAVLIEQSANEQSPDKKKEIIERIKEKTKQISEITKMTDEVQKKIDTAEKAKGDLKADDIVQSHQEDFSAAESKITNYQKEQADLRNKEKEIQDKIKNTTIPQNLKDAEKEAQDRLDDLIKNNGPKDEINLWKETLKNRQKAIEDITKQGKDELVKVQQDIKKSEKEYEQAQSTKDSLESIQPKLETIKLMQGMRHNIAERVRRKWSFKGRLDKDWTMPSNTLNPDEKEHMAAQIEKGKSKEEKTKEKERELNAKALAKEQRDYAAEHPGQENKP